MQILEKADLLHIWFSVPQIDVFTPVYSFPLRARVHGLRGTYLRCHKCRQVSTAVSINEMPRLGDKCTRNRSSCKKRVVAKTEVSVLLYSTCLHLPFIYPSLASPNQASIHGMQNSVDSMSCLLRTNHATIAFMDRLEAGRLHIAYQRTACHYMNKFIATNARHSCCDLHSRNCCESFH